MRIILDTDNEQNFVDLWNPERNNWERYIKCEEKEETKTTTRESIEALGYACGEMGKCFANGWEKSLKNKPLTEEDKKIERITNKAFLNSPFGELVGGKFNEIIDAINEMREDK